jgi:hypothetical protein
MKLQGADLLGAGGDTTFLSFFQFFNFIFDTNGKSIAIRRIQFT